LTATFWFSELEKISLTDALTGLANRRHLMMLMVIREVISV
jgi:PleD family two-component response regulator